MKKMMIFIMLICFMVGIKHSSFGSTDYRSFESITLTTGDLLSDYSSDDYKSYYKKITRRKFSGWNIHIVNSDVKATYVSETLFSYYNDGYTEINYTYTLDRKVSSKLGLSSSGSIGIKSTSTSKVFKNNLDASLKLSKDYTISTDDKESYEIDLKVDPGTQVDLYIYGEGKVTNGVAARYFFWIRADRGGFEVFIVTTEYQRLEKKKI